MARESILFKFWLCAVLVVSAILGLSEMLMALESMDSDELQHHSPALKAGRDETPSGSQPLSEKARCISREKGAEASGIAIFPGDTAPRKISGNESGGASEVLFQGAVCFQCHGPNDIQAADKTRKQWRLLIELDGHALIQPIPWSTPEEKQDVMRYLSAHAKDIQPKSEGIGVWK